MMGLTSFQPTTVLAHLLLVLGAEVELVVGAVTMADGAADVVEQGHCSPAHQQVSNPPFIPMAFIIPLTCMGLLNIGQLPTAPTLLCLLSSAHTPAHYWPWTSRPTSGLRICSHC